MNDPLCPILNLMDLLYLDNYYAQNLFLASGPVCYNLESKGKASQYSLQGALIIGNKIFKELNYVSPCNYHSDFSRCSLVLKVRVS